MKSYKREVALSALVLLYAFVGYAIYVFAQGNHVQAIVDLLSILILPTFATVAAAFGLDSFFKQNPRMKDSSQSTLPPATSSSEIER